MNANKINFHIDRDIQGVELMDAYYESNNSAPHAHNEFAFGVMENGILNYNPETPSAKVISKGYVAMVNPGSLHSCENVNDKGYKFRMFYIQPEVLEKIANDIHQDVIKSPRFDEFAVDVYLEKRLLHLHYCLFSNELDTIQKQNYFYETFAYLIKTHSIIKPFENKTDINSIIIKRVIEYLHTNFDSKVNLDELANIAGISSYHLNRMFSKHKGIPPHQYLINLRLNKARELLKQKCSVTEVTYKTGFFDQSHFTRNFKLFLGITPKQYQLAIK